MGVNVSSMVQVGQELVLRTFPRDFPVKPLFVILVATRSRSQLLINFADLCQKTLPSIFCIIMRFSHCQIVLCAGSLELSSGGGLERFALHMPNIAK